MRWFYIVGGICFWGALFFVFDAFNLGSLYRHAITVRKECNYKPVAVHIVYNKDRSLYAISDNESGKLMRRQDWFTDYDSQTYLFFDSCTALGYAKQYEQSREFK